MSHAAQVIADLSSYRGALAADRSLASAETGHSFHVILAGNANLDFMAPAIRVGLAEHGLSARTTSTPFANWIPATFNDTAADAWVIWLSSMGATRGLTERPDPDVKAIAAGTQRLVERGCIVVIVLPEATQAENDPFSPFVRWRAELCRELEASVHSSVVCLGVDHLVRGVGLEAWTATRYWEQAKAPCHPDSMTAVGLEVAQVIARTLRPTVKAIAVDLDDTLWGGLVGEVGPAGLQLDPDGKGRAYLELQRYLLDQSERGIAISVVSKNDHSVARRPFTERPEMILDLGHFVRFDASWEPKYKAIAALAKQLNIGLDAICFLDDSAFEREEAQQMLPGLVVPTLDPSPHRRVEQIIRSRLFMTPRVTDEDRLRVSFYRRAADEPLSESLDHADAYLAGLQMHLDVLDIGADQFDRALSLLHKTNQFNLSLWRPGPQELREYLEGKGRYARAYRLKDRLGDAGTIAVLLASIDEGQAKIDAWVMSCRVFSRGVEWAIADHLAGWLRNEAATSVEASYTPGPRNGLVRDVLTALGLESVNSDAAPFAGEAIQAPNHYVTVIDR